MAIKHTHPTYDSAQERSRRLTELKKACRESLARTRKPDPRAD